MKNFILGILLASSGFMLWKIFNNRFEVYFNPCDDMGVDENLERRRN